MCVNICHETPPPSPAPPPHTTIFHFMDRCCGDLLLPRQRQDVCVHKPCYTFKLYTSQDYALIVPAETYTPFDLELQPIDTSGDFFTECVDEGFVLKWVPGIL